MPAVTGAGDGKVKEFMSEVAGFCACEIIRRSVCDFHV